MSIIRFEPPRIPIERMKIRRGRSADGAAFVLIACSLLGFLIALLGTCTP